MSYTPRKTRPTKGNKYYMTKASGGYSPCIKGSPTDSQCDVLSNCVGYAVGRFNEIGGYGKIKYLGSTNAENFINAFCKKQGLEYGMTPKLGSCIVWAKGKVGVSSDGAGHIAIIEEIIDENTIKTSESGYGSSTPFSYKTRKKNDGIWGKDASKYTLQGFIYNPAVKEEVKKDAHDTANKTVNVGDKYTLKCSVKVYSNSGDAKNHKNSKGTYAKGDYYIYKIYNGMYNITKKKGYAGSWINPADNK